MADVTIRAFEMADWQDVAELFLAPKCRWGTLQLPYQSRDDLRHKLENPPPHMHRLVAVDNQSHKVVGMLGLHKMQGRRSHAGSIGMFVHDDFQNQGVGGALLAACQELAKNWLGLMRIELTVFTDNPGAIHLYQKHGFVIEGTMQQYARRNGEYVDAYAMAWLDTK